MAIEMSRAHHIAIIFRTQFSVYVFGSIDSPPMHTHTETVKTIQGVYVMNTIYSYAGAVVYHYALIFPCDLLLWRRFEYVSQIVTTDVAINTQQYRS